MRRMALGVALALASAAADGGPAYCIRVTSEHNADTTDLARFRNFHVWRDKKDNDLAVAIWQYLCDYETGLYHFYEVVEGPDPFAEYATMREPLKILNVYNCGYCGIFGPTVEGIYRGCGFTTGRSFGLSGWAHCATEIFYAGAWHYFDVDVRGALVKPDGTVASLKEAQTDKQLWLDSIGRIKPFFPHHGTPREAAKVADIYAKSGVDFQYRWFQGSHTADYSLRPGETFTRWWQPKDGHWNHRPEYNREKWVRDLILRPPIGMKPNHRDFTKWNHGEGLFHYSPNLTSTSRDFDDGVYSSKDAKPEKDGLRLAAKSGEAIFRIFTPFVIAPKVNDILKEDDDTDASVIALDAQGDVQVAISLDNGLSWTDVARLARPAVSQTARSDKPTVAQTIDLTKWVKGTYGYLLRIRAAGEGGATIRSLVIDTWVQVAPISLPRLKKGTNHLRYDAGDRYGGLTEAVLVLPNVADPDDLKRHAVEMPKDYDPKRKLDRIHGDVVVRLPAPPGTKIAWFSLGATFNTHQEQGAKNTDNRIAYAVGREGEAPAEPKDFTEVYKADVPTWVQHWRYNYDTDMRLDKPADVVFARFTGRPGVNVIRACLHVTPAVPHDPAVTITHGYQVGERLVEKAVQMKSPGDYTIDCDGDVESLFLRIEKPSSRAQ
ncbi:MAG: hypothetical protein FJ290_11310 [Planctomycetes bacterium]|nr:hypothetical protein [Planctomycetota bacterium]